jgi:hypothetical protein
LAHFGRDNDSPGQPWNAPIAFGSSDVVDAVSMIQSDFGFPGNLEVVTKVGNHLEFYWRDSGPAFNWHGPFAIGFAALTVPDLTNLPLPRARQALSNSALSVGRVRTLPPESGTGQLGPEVVVFQLPVPGEQVPRGTRVDISLRRLRIRPFPTFAAVGAGGV